MGKLVILSGPSCVGKGPLVSALKCCHPELVRDLVPLVLYNSRSPRPGERDGVDYHFRTRQQVEGLRGQEGFLVLDVRGDLQAVDLSQMARDLESRSLFFEGNPFMGGSILDAAHEAGITTTSAFLSPLTEDELCFFAKTTSGGKLEDFVADVMRRKLLRRTSRQKGLLSLKDLEEVERRCGSAFRELKEAWRFDHVIPNHDGEDSENWSAFYYPVGDARKATEAFAAILSGEELPPEAEKWQEGFPDNP